jgi:hypothetical protein
MQSWKAWWMRPSGLIKRGGRAITLGERTLRKVENVPWEQISKIDLNHYWIKAVLHFMPLGKSIPEACPRKMSVCNCFEHHLLTIM